MHLLTLLTLALATLTSALPVPDALAPALAPADEPAHDFTIGPIDSPIPIRTDDLLPTRVTTKFPTIRPTFTFTRTLSFYPPLNPTLPTFDPTGSGTVKPTFTVRPPGTVKPLPTRLPPFYTFETLHPGPEPTILV